MKLKLLLPGIALVGTVGAVYMIWPELFGFCEARNAFSGPICLSPLAYPYGVTLLPFAVALLCISIVSILVTRITYRRWVWFTLWYGIVTLLLMFLAGASELDIGALTIPLFDLEKVAWLLAGIYAVISLILLGISEFLVRRRR